MTPEELADKALGEVDAIAREYDHYEYGLPWEDGVKERMVGVVAAAIREAEAAMRERCARICEQTHKELDAEFDSSGGCTDTALIAAERIRSGEEPK